VRPMCDVGFLENGEWAGVCVYECECEMITSLMCCL